MKYKNTLIVVATIILVGAGLFFYLDQHDNQDNEIDMTPTPSTITETPSPEPTDEVSQSPENWETYESDNGLYSIARPPEITVNETAVGSTELQLIGDTQPEQGTEIIDGIRMVIETGDYEDESFLAFVEQQHMDMSEEPTTDEIIPIQQRQTMGRTLYWWEVTSLGEFTHLYLELQNDQYWHASYLVEDPENQGYQDIVDDMVSSLELSP